MLSFSLFNSNLASTHVSSKVPAIEVYMRKLIPSFVLEPSITYATPWD